MAVIANQESAKPKAETMRNIIVNKINPANQNYDFITKVFRKLEQLETEDK